MSQNQITNNPRVIVIQKLYSHFINQESVINYPKHRFKKFIKDVVKGTIERKDLIENLIDTELKDHINKKKTEFITNIMLMAAIYEFMYMHKTPINVIISEYLKVSDFFSSKSQKKFLNAILDRASKISRSKDE